MSLLEAFLRQLVIFLCVCTYFLVVNIIKGNIKDIRYIPFLLSHSIPDPIKDPVWLWFIFFMWFGFGTVYRAWTDMPLLGIWYYIFNY